MVLLFELLEQPPIHSKKGSGRAEKYNVGKLCVPNRTADPMKENIVVLNLEVSLIVVYHVPSPRSGMAPMWSWLGE